MKKSKLRGWWKEFKMNVSCYGIFKALLKETPWYYTIINFYYAILYRTTHRYNIVKLGKPMYYEVPIRLLYAPFVVLKEYVEEFEYLLWDNNDKVRDRYKGIKAIEEKINAYYKGWDEDKTTGWETRELDNRYDYQEEINALKEAIRLYIWWTETFPTFEDNSPWSLNFDKMYPKGVPSFGERFVKCLEDGTELIYFNHDNLPKEVKDFHSQVMKDTMAYEVRIEEEITNNLISLMKIRNKLYD